MKVRLWMLGLSAVLVGDGFHQMAAAQDQAPPGRALIQGLSGYASLTNPGEPARAAAVGSLVEPGARLQTGPDAALDLLLGGNVGAVRLMENSLLHLNDLEMDPVRPGTVAEIQLNLESGILVGHGNQSGFEVRYQIKIPTGIAGIGGGHFRIHARGYVVLLEGTVIFVAGAPEREPEAFTLRSPPPVYYSPVEGVRPAPEALIKEIQKQTRARLKSRSKSSAETVPYSISEPLDLNRPPRRRF